MTGYFGPRTQAAVQQFQCAENIICAGTPETTGWGVVGPRTRAAIKNVSCGDQPPPPPPPPTTISCTLSTDNPIIYQGESATLSWTKHQCSRRNHHSHRWLCLSLRLPHRLSHTNHHLQRPLHERQQRRHLSDDGDGVEREQHRLLHLERTNNPKWLVRHGIPILHG